MRSINPHILIFSVDRLLDEDESNRKIAVELLKKEGVPFLEGTGVYLGIVEKSFLVDLGQYNTVEYFHRWNIVQGLARRFNQKCILYSDNERESFLIGSTGDITHRLGKLKENNIIPEECNNYSVFNGRFFITE